MRVYDPCSGSGGMLILASEYLAEHGGDPRNLALYGQESNGGVWSISKMNMILHGIPDADLQNGDTLAEPAAHRRRRADALRPRALQPALLAELLAAGRCSFPERFRYGWCPEAGKKADLMFVQHMLAVLRPGGMAVTVMPHGVLFRGGEEKKIREQLVQPRPPGGGHRPGAEPLLRHRHPGLRPRAAGRGRQAGRSGAARSSSSTPTPSIRAGRAQNYLEPEHVEKIVAAFERFEDVPGFAAVVTAAALEAEDYNLNIRRYADNAPPPEPHDVRAHLLGGVPGAEVEAKAELFRAHGLRPDGPVRPRGVGGRNGDGGAAGRYLDFRADLAARADLGPRIEADAGLRAREQQLADAFAAWWDARRVAIAELTASRDFMGLRARLLATFADALGPVGLLDRFRVAGVVARWWGAAQYDLKTLMARGFPGVVEAWATTIATALEDENDRSDPLGHKLVRHLLAGYLDEIAAAEAAVAELDARIKAAEATDEDGDEDAEGNDDEFALSEIDLKDLKRKRTAARGRLRRLRDDLVARLAEAQAALSDDDARELVLGILRADLAGELDRRVAEHRQAVVAAFEAWWDKYRVTLEDIEAERAEVADRLGAMFGSLGYDTAEPLRSSP